MCSNTFSEGDPIRENFTDKDAAVSEAVYMACDSKPWGAGEQEVRSCVSGKKSGTQETTDTLRTHVLYKPESLTKVPSACGPGHVQSAHIQRDDLQLIIWLQKEESFCQEKTLHNTVEIWIRMYAIMVRTTEF